MTRFDVKRDLRELYVSPRDKFVFVDVPLMSFLMIDGHGDPNSSPAYQEALNAIYAVAYSVKFALKQQGVDYVVPPLEGLWWMENMAEFSLAVKERWDWTMMIMQPESVTAEIVARVRDEVAQKKDLPALPRLRLAAYNEGLAVQTLYVGAYQDEGPTIARLHEFIHHESCVAAGKHHEIYLSDPHRTAPARLRTIIRQPVRKIAKSNGG